MRLLLDTHTVLWFWWDDPRLSGSALETIRNPTNQIGRNQGLDHIRFASQLSQRLEFTENKIG